MMFSVHPGLLVVLVVLAAVVSAQNYHFSNGWHPGKRSPQALKLRPDIVASLAAGVTGSRGGTGGGFTDTDRQTQEAECGARLQALAIVGKMLQEEATKTQHACATPSSPAAALRELLQNSANKWK